MLLQLVSLILLTPLALFMLNVRFLKCFIYSIFDLYVRFIPSPNAWYMWWIKIFGSSRGYTVYQDGSMKEFIYCFSCDDERTWTSKEMNNIRYIYSFIFLFVLGISWFLNNLESGFMIVLVLYWFNSIFFLKPGESWN